MRRFPSFLTSSEKEDPICQIHRLTPSGAWQKQLGMFLPAWILTASLSAQTLQIVSPVEGTVFHPGQTMVVTVDATPLAFKTVVVGGILGPPQSLSAPPYQFRMRIPSKIDLGPCRLTALGVTHAGNAIGSKWVTVAIERPDSPLQWKPSPPP